MARRGLFELIGDLPRLGIDLVRAEIEAFTQELKDSAKRAGIGIGLIAAALLLLCLTVIVLVIAAVAGLATVLPVWASALIIAGGLLLVAGILAAVGVQRIKGAGPDFRGRIDSIQVDLETIQGYRKQD